jgi:hypothetical protein
MILTNKAIIALSAVLSIGVVGGLTLLDTGAQARTPVVKIMDRHPELAGPVALINVSYGDAADTTVSTKRSDRLVEAGCTGQAWPYAGKDCATRAVRTITIEQRSDEASVLLRIPGKMARN